MDLTLLPRYLIVDDKEYIIVRVYTVYVGPPSMLKSIFNKFKQLFDNESNNKIRSSLSLNKLTIDTDGRTYIQLSYIDSRGYDFVGVYQLVKLAPCTHD